MAFLLLESGDFLLQESGDKFLLDEVVCRFLLESGDLILQEDGAFLLLEQCGDLIQSAIEYIVTFRRRRR